MNLGALTPEFTLAGTAILVVLLVAVPIIIGAFRGAAGGYYRGPGMMGYGWGWWMPVTMVVFWGLVVWGIVTLVRYFGRTGCCAGGGDSALEILRKRYAGGEINREEFEEKKRTLL